ncbi:hypothetical protein ACIBFB_18065 [Nocardiopsis sp. NPDC050513]|uniref:hypothetical protein n=1 Tax=Nocardiopsis sp. NPDC050513 TaxID=3364338 RepID=UPI0037A346ED
MTENGGGRDSASRDGDSWFKPSENRYRSQSEYQDPMEDGTAGDTVFPDSGGYAGLSTSRPPMVEPYPEALGGPPQPGPPTSGAISYPGAGASAYEPLTRIPGEPDPYDEPSIPGIAASAEVPLPPEAPEDTGRGRDPWSAESSDAWAAEPWSADGADDGAARADDEPWAPGASPDRSVEPGSGAEGFGESPWPTEASGGDEDGWSPPLAGTSAALVSDEPLSPEPFAPSGGSAWGAGSGVREEPWAPDPSGGSDEPPWSPRVDVPSAGEPWGSEASPDGGAASRIGGEEPWSPDDDAPWSADSGSVGDDRPWSPDAALDGGVGSRSGGAGPGEAPWSPEADADGWSHTLAGGSPAPESDDPLSPEPFGASGGSAWDAESGVRDEPWSTGPDHDAPWSADGAAPASGEPWASDTSFSRGDEPGPGEEAWSAPVSDEPLTPEPYGASGGSAWDSGSAVRDEPWPSGRAGGADDAPWAPDASLDQDFDTRSGASGRAEESWSRSTDDPLSPEPYGASGGSAWDSGSAVRDEPWPSEGASGDAPWAPDAALDGGVGPRPGGAAPAEESWSPSGSAAPDEALSPEPYGAPGAPEWDAESGVRDEPWTPDAALDRVNDTWSSNTPAASEPWTPGDGGLGARTPSPSASGPDTWEDELGPRSDAPSSWDGRTEDLDTWAGAGGPATDRYDDELSPAPGGGTGNTWVFSREDARLPESVREAERRRRESGPAQPEYRDWGGDSGEPDDDGPGEPAGATQMFDALSYDEAQDAYAGQTYDSRYHDTGFDGDPDEVYEDEDAYDDPAPGVPSDLGPEPDPEPDPAYDDGFTPADYGMPVDRSKARRRRDPIAGDFPGFDDRPPGGEAGDAYPGYDSIDFLADTERGALVTLWLGLASLLPGIGLATAVLALFVTGPKAKRAIRGSGGTLDGLGFITTGTVFAVIGILVTVISVALFLVL